VKVHISVDMEGISGVADPADTTPGAPHYEYCRRLMTAECNAAIEGCFEGGATEIVVNDSHGPMVNLLQEQLDRRAKIIRGRSKSLGMMQGIDEQTAATVFIGYHAAAGHDDGVLNHTMRGRDIQGVFLNDEPAGEMRLNAALAGWFGIPVALVSGDNVLCAEVREQLGPVEAVQVKEAIDKYTALSVHPDVAQELIRDAARRAVQRLGAGDSGQAPPPYRVGTPTTLRLAWNSTNIAALCENIPGVRRVAPREIEYTSADYPEIYRLLRVLLAVAGYCASAAYTYD
jgi:D-amino peptidase